MAERITVARPYARAAFDVAARDRALPGWSAWLAAAAAAAADPAVQPLLTSPRVPKEQLAAAFIDSLGAAPGAAAADFIRLLADNRRLGLLPEIARLFELMRAEAGRAIEATVTSAAPLDEAARAALVAALKARLDREVTLQCETDHRLIGGAVIRAGDLVIDGSVSGKLERLAAALAR